MALLCKPLFSEPGTALSRLAELQFGQRSKILIFSQPPIGLGGQIFSRLLGLKLALMLDRTVVFPHPELTPYREVFEPLHSQQLDVARLSGGRFEPERPQDDDILTLDFWDFWGNADLRQAVIGYSPLANPSMKFPLLYSDGALLSFCRLTDQNAAFVEAQTQRLAVGPRTLGVHVRRGDKAVETPYLPLQLIEDAVARQIEAHGWDSIFLNSDDPEVKDRLRLPPGVRLIYDHQEKRYNNASHRFLASHPELAAEETRTGIKIIYLMGRCGAVVGQSNAHMAALAANQICFRNGGSSYGELLDGFAVLKRSPALGVYYKLKKAARAIGKRALPRFSVKSGKPSKR